MLLGYAGLVFNAPCLKVNTITHTDTIIMTMLVPFKEVGRCKRTKITKKRKKVFVISNRFSACMLLLTFIVAAIVPVQPGSDTATVATDDGE